MGLTRPLGVENRFSTRSSVGLGPAPHRPVTVVKGVAKPTCLATRLGAASLYSPGSHRIRKVSLTKSVALGQAHAATAGQRTRHSKPSTADRTLTGSANTH